MVFTLPNQHNSKSDTTFLFQARHCKHLRTPALPCVLFPFSMGFTIRRVLQLTTEPEVIIPALGLRGLSTRTIGPLGKRIRSPVLGTTSSRITFESCASRNNP